MYARAGRAADDGIFGKGLLGGLPPGDESSSDGRARMLNVPARVKVQVFDRVTHRAVAAAVSAADGTWLIRGLEEDRLYYVIGFDPWEQVNAAIQDLVRPYVVGA